MAGADFRGGGGGGGGWREMKRFGLQVLLGRWFMVFASFLIMAMSGATYMFSLYSSDIKKSLGYDQSTLNLLSFFKDVGGNVGLLPGFINEVSPPWVILSLGVIMNFFGYFMIWLAITGKNCQAKSLADVSLYLYWGKLTDICHHRSFSHLRQELPGKQRKCFGLVEGVLWV
ncbi:MFS TRANSPORTER [Salix koriyanagi]|uniref:MFS TRANSPORTER n=1 Tax=Salix koriyanagi TaxID=2511006 RepID=A0A9Q0VDI2_9ROSI|nr:MFS TRANSPORTER [Salix koriyanagi]